jgi:hypothetical protein
VEPRIIVGLKALTFSKQSAYRQLWGCQPYAPAALYSWYSFLLEAESTPRTLAAKLTFSETLSSLSCSQNASRPYPQPAESGFCLFNDMCDTTKYTRWAVRNICGSNHNRSRLIGFMWLAVLFFTFPHYHNVSSSHIIVKSFTDHIFIFLSLIIDDFVILLPLYSISL